MLSLITAATHTPHGDGNKSRLFCLCKLRGCNSHPSRGRKRVPFLHLFQFFLAATHTPNGGRKQFVVCISVDISQLQLTPLTGTETPTPLIFTVTFISCNSHPSRGRKLLKDAMYFLLRQAATHTPHGDGNASDLMFAIRFITAATHTPHGDGNICALV